MAQAADGRDEARLHALLTEIFETCDVLTESVRLALRARHADETVAFDAAWAIATEHAERFEGGHETLGRPLSSGEMLGGFQVVAWLGGGGSATVYRARSTANPERLVALKVIEFSCEEPARHRAKFAREVRALEAIRHRHVASIFDHGIVGDRGYYAMELVEGPTLSQVLADLVESPELLDGARMRRIAAHVGDIARALHAVHLTGHVHCDVKPANVVVERQSGDVDPVPRGRAVLIDFGLARVLEGQKTTVHVSMTPRYAPMELVKGQRVDVRCDVYSLGVTLYDLLAGPASRTRTPSYGWTSDIRRVSPGIDRDLASIIAMATHPDRRCRHPSASVLADDLDAWRDGRAVLARRLPAWRHVVAWHLQNPLRTLRATARLSLVVILLVVSNHIVTQWRCARDATAAYERGDVASLVQDVRRLDRLTRSILSRSRMPATMLEAITDGDERGPFGMATALERRDPYKAWVLAATPMVVAGSGADPLCARFLASELERARSSMVLHSAGDDTSDIVRLAARIAHERPALTRDDLAYFSGLRRFAFTLLDSVPRRGVLVLHGYTILSGCGLASDISYLLARARGRSVLDEERRLAMAAAERTIRRSHAIGVVDRIDYEGLAAAAIDLVAAYRGDTLAMTRESARARDFDVYRRFVLASVLASRASGDLAHFDAEWRRMAVRGAVTREFADLGGELAAAAGIVDPVHAFPTPDSTSVDGWGRAGRLLGLANDEVLLEQIRGVLAGRAVGRESVEAFERERHLADLERVGRIDGLEADADTRLGAVIEGTADYVDLTRGDIRPSTNDPGQIASWNFRPREYGVAGSADLVSLRAASSERADGETHYLRLFRFGESSIRLRFRTESLAGRFDRLILRLVLQTAARDYFPHHGVSFIDVFLDGDRLGREQLVDVSHVHHRPIVLAPAHRMTDGDHEVEIRLSNRSTTQLWILDAIVEVVE